MGWFLLTGACTAYGAATSGVLRWCGVPAGRALAAGAWSVVLALTGIYIAVVLGSLTCLGDSGGDEVTEFCRDAREGAARIWFVYATPAASAILVGSAALAFFRRRAVAGRWLVVGAIVAGVFVPAWYVGALVGGFAA